MPMDWTPPPRGGGQGEPDLNKVLSDVKGKMPNFKKAKGLWIIVIIVALFALGSSAYYTVGPEETGVVLRFGRYIGQTTPGLHFKMPLGIDTAVPVKTGRVFKEEFGFRGISPGIKSRFDSRGYAEESLMLTGDLNVIEVKWIVQYKIRDPQLWLFAVQDGRSAIRDLSEAVMREIVGNRYGGEVLTLARVEIAGLAQKRMQELLNFYKTGVQVVTVALQDVNPPGPVQPAFNEVNEARQQKERMINEAQEAYNREVPKAQGEAQRVISEAEGYETEVVNRATGEANRFESVLKAYKAAEDVTRRRLYLDAMEKIIKQSKKIVVVDEKVKGVLPLMNLTQGTAAQGMGEVSK